MKLYNTPISPNGKRVNICALELGIALEPKLIDFARGDQRSPDYLALNPMGKVPTLTDGTQVIWESAAILYHLAAQRPGALWPAELRAQTETMRWLFFCSCHLDSHFPTLVVERFIKARRNLPADTHLAGHAVAELARFLPVVEQQLTGREYVTGAFGLGDIAMGCTLELAPLLQLDLSPYPNVRGWLERLRARPSWRAATPPMA